MPVESKDALFAAKPAASSPASTPASAANGEGSVKETIESILVAFILAFIFRAFVVEAFVIPTGSMAPTLLGAHMRFTCTDCGYPFEVNYSGKTVGDDVEIPRYAAVLREQDSRGNTLKAPRLESRVYALYCPNCGLQVPKTLSGDDDNDATGPPVHYGDRILVLKYLYLFQDPRHWDVVVFKSPDDPKFAMNYIKRLIATPGESVYVLDGDIYVREKGAAEYHILTKPRVAQDALWRVVYDNDFLPRRTSGWAQPWAQEQPGSGWKLGEGKAPSRVFTFSGSATAGESALRFDPGLNPATHSFTDWLVYDLTKSQQSLRWTNTFETPNLNPINVLDPRNTVSDLKLQCFYRRTSGDGPLRLELKKFDDQFAAEITPGKFAIYHRAGAGAEPVKLAEGPLPGASGSGPTQLEFTNVDFRVSLRVDGTDVFRSTPAQYAPPVERLMEAYESAEPMPPPEVRIVAAAQTCTLSHLSLWRDVYYTNRDDGGTPLNQGTPREPVDLGDDEYFVLGDNSVNSLDARYWTRSVRLPYERLDADAGRVPGRFMLGKAFFVYWPAGYRPTDWAPGIVPNFGDMRFIH